MIVEGSLDARGHKYAIVLSRFNAFVTEKLLEGAMDCIRRHGGDIESVDVVKVPGSFEIPLVAQKLALTKKYDALICLGAVIRGQTAHFDYVASEAAKGVAHVALGTGIPTIFGILTTNSIEDAIDRAGTKSGNKGWDAAMAAMETVNLLKHLK